MDEAAMRKLAQETGGRFYTEADLSALPGAVVISAVPDGGKVPGNRLSLPCCGPATWMRRG